MRHPQKRSPFRRSVRDAEGNILRTMEFAPGEVVRLTGDDLEAVRHDIGGALVIAKLNHLGIGSAEIDFAATERASGRDLRPEFEPKPPPMPFDEYNPSRRLWIGRSSKTGPAFR
ncbi:hypothetical protein [Planctomycetes bacterium TBK1r]